MYSIQFKDVNINSDFFFDLQKLNAEVSILSQWKQLEMTGCINNFRIIADKNNELFREGYFFSDSDAYKWLDAACRVQQTYFSNDLNIIIKFFIDLVLRTQEPDGYIFTYNQIHFPGQRWKNLLLEHELYCLGHLIEAGISHYQINGDSTLLNACIKAANLLVGTFLHKKSSSIPGHEEIELSLFKLFNLTQKEEFFELGKEFLERRGKVSFFWFRFFKASSSTGNRMHKVQGWRKKFYQEHGIPEVILPDNVKFAKPKGIRIKSFLDFASGKYIQSHKPIRKQIKPEGHSVRYSYLMTASTMYYHLQPDNSLLDALEKSWKHMVFKRMFVTGGIGQIPVTEGFDKDYQLDPKFAYCESCAGIGSLLWSWQMIQITHDAWYADLFEWQLYNAVLPGLSTNGKSYFYRNPLEIESDYGRKEWYKVACCPSNISRTIASLGEQILTINQREIWFLHYISSEITISKENNLFCSIQSKFPFTGEVEIKIKQFQSNEITIHLRIPSWAETVTIIHNDRRFEKISNLNNLKFNTASGYNPFKSSFFDLKLESNTENKIMINFSMSIKLIFPDQKVVSVRGKSSLSRGPLIYCLEQSFNSFDIFSTKIDQNSLQFNKDSKFITGKTKTSDDVIFTPYYRWANKEQTKMTIFTIFD